MLQSLLLVVLLHACVDVLPFSSEFISIWRRVAIDRRRQIAG